MCHITEYFNYAKLSVYYISNWQKADMPTGPVNLHFFASRMTKIVFFYEFKQEWIELIKKELHPNT
jgi:hypothetical protein